MSTLTIRKSRTLGSLAGAGPRGRGMGSDDFRVTKLNLNSAVTGTIPAA